MMCILPWPVAPLLAYLFASGSDFGVDFVIVDTIPYMFHAWALLAVMVVAIVTGWGRNMMTEEEHNAESEALMV